MVGPDDVKVRNAYDEGVVGEWGAPVGGGGERGRRDHDRAGAVLALAANRPEKAKAMRVGSRRREGAVISRSSVAAAARAGTAPIRRSRRRSSRRILGAALSCSQCTRRRTGRRPWAWSLPAQIRSAGRSARR